MNLEKIRQDAELFLSELMREFYENGAGLKEELNISEIYKKYQHLFTKESLEHIESLLEEAKDEEARKLRYLKEFISDNFLGIMVKELSDEATTLETKSTVKIEGNEVPFRYSAVLLMNEANRTKRESIDNIRDTVKEKLNPLLEERTDKLHQLAVDLGYKHYADLYGQIKGIDLPALETTMKSFLKETEGLYEKQIAQALDKIGVDLEDAKRHDAAFLFRAKQFDKYFPKDKVVSTLKKTLQGIGINLDKQRNIKLDVEERPKKSPRAFCAPIKVPEEIMLVIMPTGGQDDYSAILHEAGHAEHFANTSKREPFEYRLLGDNSVTESYAFLLDYLMTDGNWLERYLEMDDVEAYLQFAFLAKLYMLRRYAGKLAYELKLHTKGLADMKEVYAETLTEAVRFKYKGVDYLMDVDDGFYCAQYLRAWIFEAMLRAKLKKEIDRKWFLKKDAGDYLKELWAVGQKYNADELASRLGYTRLDAKPLVDELKSGLS